MCKSKMSTDVIDPMSSNPNTPTSRRFSLFRRSRGSASQTDNSSINSNNLNFNLNFNFPSTTTGSSYTSSISSKTSLSSLKDTLPETPHIYDFSELAAATNKFLNDRYSSSSSSSSWRCIVRGQEVLVFQRKLRRRMNTEQLKEKLSLISRSHHSSLVKLRGVSISGNYIYLVYDFVNGLNLSTCLKNPKNPSFTVLSKWISRMQIATDLAHGLDYIHHCTGLNAGVVHNHIKSSSVIVQEPMLNAIICHFGTAELCGEVAEEEIVEKLDMKMKGVMKRTGSGGIKFEGTRGYMAPEFQWTGVATRETDVYAFGVVILELVSGEEALRYCLEEGGGGYRRISVVETAREAVGDGGGGRLRRWVDRRLKDSYPVEVAERMVRLGLECVEEDPGRRPDMGRVAATISKLFLDSRHWAEQIEVPTDFSVSLAPR